MDSREQVLRGLRLHQAGKLSEAREIYEQVLEFQPDLSDALHLLGLVEHQQGYTLAALQLLDRAVTLQPNSAVYLNNLGVVLCAAGELRRAVDIFCRSVALAPGKNDALLNLARTAVETCTLDQALEVLGEAALAAPQHAECHLALAIVLDAADRQTEAQARLDLAEKQSPHNVELLRTRADMLFRSQHTGKALMAYRELGDSSGFSVELHAAIAVASEAHGDAESARSHWKAANLIRGCPLRELRCALSIPLVMQSSEEMTAYAEEARQAVRRYRSLNHSATARDIFQSGCIPPFALLHDRVHHAEFLSELSDAFAAAFADQHPSRSARKHQVGYIVGPGDEGIFARFFLPLIEGLQRKGPKGAIVCSPRAVRRLQSEMQIDVPLIPILGNLQSSIESIRALGFGAIWHNKVGSSALTYCLGHCRLAPIQLVSSSTLYTTGVGAIDYFLSSDWVEGPSAERHYRERLVRLPCLPYFERRRPAVSQTKTRADFGWPDQVRVYLCNQKAVKYHPDFDEVIAEILDRDPSAIFVLTAGIPSSCRVPLQRRLQRRLLALAERLRFLPLLPHDEYLQAVGLADVIVDTYPAGGGATTFDAMQVGTPVVTMPTEFSRGRLTQAVLNQIGLSRLICPTIPTLVSAAVSIAKDESYRQWASRLISHRSDALWDGGGCISAHSNFLCEKLQLFR